MPNYVYGNLYVTGEKKALLKFKEFADGEEEYIDELSGEKKISNRILDMNKFIPYPKRFKDMDKQAQEHNKKMRILEEQAKTDEKAKKEYENELILAELEGNDIHKSDGYNQGGYDWCVMNWGTKWNFCDVELEEETDEQLHYSFSTAWNMPIPVLFKMSKMFPALTFEYLGNEESEEFEVEYEFKAGKLTKQEEKDWKDIQIEAIKSGEISRFDEDSPLYKELDKHKGHDIIYINEGEIKEFRCKTCEKSIWDTTK